MNDKVELNYVLSGYFTDVMLSLIDKYPSQMLKYLYTMRKDAIKKIVYHSNQKALSLLCQKLLNIESFNFVYQPDNSLKNLISESANDPEMVYTKFKNKVKEFKESKLDENNFDRIKKMIYGEYIKEYNDVTEISKVVLSDFMKGIDSFDYLEEIDGVDLDFVNQVLKQYFVDDKMVLSVVY